MWATIVLAVAALFLGSAARAGEDTTLQPGFNRIAGMASFIGRIRVLSVTPAKLGRSECGIVVEATVREALLGDSRSDPLRFVSAASPTEMQAGSDYFAMLFPHAFAPKDRSDRCWLEAAPLYAGISPRSVLPFDADAAIDLGGEFVRVETGNVLEGLFFSGLEFWHGGERRFVASWELVRAYVHQAPAAWKAIDRLPAEAPPLITPDFARPTDPVK